MNLTFLEFTGKDARMDREATTAGLATGLILIVRDVRSRVPVAEVVDDLVGVVELEMGLDGERFLGVVLTDGGDPSSA